MDTLSLLYDFGIDAENRRIYFVDNINENNLEVVMKAIHIFNTDEHRRCEPIEVFICSNGGLVDVMFALYDLFRSSASPIHTIITGSCCSAAGLVAMSGHLRFATENSFFMHHAIKAFSEDLNDSELSARAEVIKEMASKTYDLMGLHSKKAKSWWKKQTEQQGETWLTPVQMLEYGVIDEIIKNPILKKKRTPSKRKAVRKKVVKKQVVKQKKKDD